MKEKFYIVRIFAKIVITQYSYCQFENDHFLNMHNNGHRYNAHFYIDYISSTN